MANKTNKTAVPKTPGEFVTMAIPLLRNDGYKGCHTVYSGFNGAFKAIFPALDVIVETRKLQDKGIVKIIPSKGGVMIYLAKDAPKSDGSKDALRKLGLA